MKDKMPIDLDGIFDQAVAYHYSAKIVNIRRGMLSPANSELVEYEDCLPPIRLVDRGWIEELGNVAGVLAAFSAELYLKGLCIMHGLEYPTTHNLIRLYDLLPQSAKDGIEAKNQAPVTYREMLSRAKNSFVDIRYAKLDSPKSFIDWTAHLVQPLYGHVLEQAQRRPQRYHFLDRLSPEEQNFLADP